MTDFSSFEPEDQELLVSLPYSVGMYLSYADDEEGECDDERERQAIEETIKAIAELYQDNSFIQSIAMQTLSRRQDWPNWAPRAFQAINDAKKAVDVIEKNGTDADLKAYRTLLIEIATTVAQAYGEFNSFDLPEQEKSGFGALVGKIVSGFSGLSKEDDDHPMNVSASEDSAIEELKRALKSQ